MRGRVLSGVIALAFMLTTPALAAPVKHPPHKRGYTNHSVPGYGFLPGVRTVTYFTAGSVGMRYSRFLLYDSAAALASAPIFVLLGYYFGSDIESLLTRIASGERKVIAVLVALVVGAVLFGNWRAKREKKANADALEKQLETQALEPPSRQRAE